MIPMRRHVLAQSFAVACLMLAPIGAFADDDDLTSYPDGRLEGYAKPVVIEHGTSSAGTFFVLALAGGLCVGVLFKNSKRTHLD